MRCPTTYSGKRAHCTVGKLACESHRKRAGMRMAPVETCRARCTAARAAAKHKHFRNAHCSFERLQASLPWQYSLATHVTDALAEALHFAQR
eukprot:4431269-Pleurochrysis_carterae.AAC.2